MYVPLWILSFNWSNSVRVSLQEFRTSNLTKQILINDVELRLWRVNFFKNLLSYSHFPITILFKKLDQLMILSSHSSSKWFAGNHLTLLNPVIIKYWTHYLPQVIVLQMVLAPHTNLFQLNASNNLTRQWKYLHDSALRMESRKWPGLFLDGFEGLDCLGLRLIPMYSTVKI